MEFFKAVKVCLGHTNGVCGNTCGRFAIAGISAMVPVIHGSRSDGMYAYIGKYCTLSLELRNPIPFSTLHAAKMYKFLKWNCDLKHKIIFSYFPRGIFEAVENCRGHTNGGC